MTIDTDRVAVDASVADALRILQPYARDEAANSTCALPLQWTLSQLGMREKRGKLPPDPFSRYYSGNAVTANTLKSNGEGVTASVGVASRAQKRLVVSAWPFVRFVLLVACSRPLDGPRADYVWMASFFHFVLLIPK